MDEESFGGHYIHFFALPGTEFGCRAEKLSLTGETSKSKKSMNTVKVQTGDLWEGTSETGEQVATNRNTR